MLGQIFSGLWNNLFLTKLLFILYLILLYFISLHYISLQIGRRIDEVEEESRSLSHVLYVVILFFKPFPHQMSHFSPFQMRLAQTRGFNTTEELLNTRTHISIGKIPAQRCCSEADKHIRVHTHTHTIPESTGHWGALDAHNRISLQMH